MTASNEIVEQIRQTVDLVDVIGEVVQLKRRGRNYTGLCPFHNEKTPSFVVSQDKGIYKCFGCGKAGNAFTFLIDYHGFSFPEALKELAAKAGVQLPKETEFKKNKAELSRKELALKALESASIFYNKLLGTTAGKTGLSYFHKRYFSPELIKQFQLGYSSDSWDSLMNELHKQGFPQSALLDAGLIIEKDTGGSFYDRFRGRAMFPIQDFMGKVIGFGARKLNDNDTQAKYINSPQTIVYDKSKTLYGLYQGKNEIRNKKAVLLTEGYADVLTLHQAGYKNSIASSGTSLTPDQLDVLKRYCTKLYIVYDADQAGIKAAERGLEIALEKGFDVNIVQLPAGEDPDSLIREHGSNIFQAYIDEAIGFIDFKANQLKKAGALDTPAGRAESIRELLRIISTIPDKLQHNDYIAHLSALLKISELDLQKIYNEKASQEKAKAKTAVQQKPVAPRSEMPAQVAIPQENIVPEAPKKLLPEEILIINLAVGNSHYYEMMLRDFNISSHIFVTDEAKRLFSIIEGMGSGGDDFIKNILEDTNIPEADRQFFIEHALMEDSFIKEHLSEHWERFATDIEKDFKRNIHDSLLKIELTKIESEINSIQAFLRENKPFEEIREHLANLNTLHSRQEELKKQILKLV